MLLEACVVSQVEVVNELSGRLSGTETDGVDEGTWIIKYIWNIPSTSY